METGEDSSAFVAHSALGGPGHSTFFREIMHTVEILCCLALIGGTTITCNAGLNHTQKDRYPLLVGIDNQ